MSTLGELIEATPWIDTHEHLLEESDRLRDGAFVSATGMDEAFSIPADWTALIVHYGIDDLISAGLPADAARAVAGDQLDPLEKWDAVAPQLAAARNTGYFRAVDLTTERLFGARLERDTCEEIGRRLAELRRPGYYRHVLQEVANVERCHVHTLVEDPFRESAMPDLLQQDISLTPLVFGRHERLERMSGIPVGGLDDYLDVVEWCFARYAHRAVAVKCFWAYYRPLDVHPPDAPPHRAFERVRANTADLAERRAVEDFLFTRCVELATAHGLPVKLHTGYLGGNGERAFPHVYRDVQDLVPLVQAHPRTQFVLMHMGWPQQEELMALAKHQPNVVVDLCWSWICSPRAARDFVERFLTTVPASKLLCFGADYMTVENVVGHAELARRGLATALEQLVADEWLTSADAEALVPLLMRGNAERLFPNPTS